MTEAAGDTATQSALDGLISRLEGLDPAERESTLSDLHAILDRKLAASREAADSGGRAGGGGGEPPAISEWAVDAGTRGDHQLLSVDLRARPTPVPKTQAATGTSVASNGHLGVDVIHLPAGEGFPPHTHPGDHILMVLAGRGTITAGGVIQPTAPGQVYMVDGAVPHAVGAIDDHVLLAVGAPHRRIDSSERQALTAYSALLTPLGSLRCGICGVTAQGPEGLIAEGCSHSPSELD